MCLRVSGYSFVVFANRCRMFGYNCLAILLDYDVVKKIELISKYYGHTIPKHIQIIISHIENMEVYKELKKIKDEEDIEIVKGYYNKFLDDYFSDDNQRIILSKLLDALKSTFINS